MKSGRVILFFLLCGWLTISVCEGQTTNDSTDQHTDSLFIQKFKRANDFRLNYTSQRYELEFGSKRDQGPGGGIFNNVSDWLGFGLTYKFIDFDLAFSLPKTRILETGLQNLDQFRLTGSFSTRRATFRGYWVESKGLVASDAGGQFISTPGVHVLNIGLEYTHYFNFKRYSFRAATYQNESQRRSAGSVMIRVEPFFRRLGVSASIVPPADDVASMYGEQAGLLYAYAPVILVMPGYGYSWTTADGRWFCSPMVFLGGGVALNVYKGNVGERTSVNAEWKGNVVLNAGYNGDRFYISVRSFYAVDYFLLDPSYFFTSDLRLGFTAGYRFNDLEKVIPKSLF